jgi:hypothetical protein
LTVLTWLAWALTWRRSALIICRTQTCAGRDVNILILRRGTKWLLTLFCGEETEVPGRILIVPYLKVEYMRVVDDGRGTV